MDYQRNFFTAPTEASPADEESGAARAVYVYSGRIELAVNVAIATRRPLLVAGPPGSGKSTLARSVARAKKWRYLEKVVTSRTQADDLMAGFDALRRLNDAQIQGRDLLPDAAYVDPGVLWWAFDPESARRRGATDDEIGEAGARWVDATYPVEGEGDDAVVLLDEVDKADPDVPNDLLEPLDLRAFTPRHSRVRVSAGERRKVLVIVTTNGERELPPAFLRRCVFLPLEAMQPAELVHVAETHFGEESSPGLYQTLAEWVVELRATAKKSGLREPGTAEYLDTVRACRELGLSPENQVWKQVADAAMWKHEQKPQPQPTPEPAPAGAA
jgi:MoxR-like ATPase